MIYNISGKSDAIINNSSWNIINVTIVVLPTSDVSNNINNAAASNSIIISVSHQF